MAFLLPNISSAKHCAKCVFPTPVGPKKMNEPIYVTIALDEYRELVEKAERINAVKRFIAKSEYPNVSEIKAILDISEEKGGL